MLAETWWPPSVTNSGKDYCAAVKTIHLSLFRIQLEYNLAAEGFAMLLARHAVVEEWEPDHYVDAAFGYRAILNSGTLNPRALAKKACDKCIAGTLGKRPPPWPQHFPGPMVRRGRNAPVPLFRT